MPNLRQYLIKLCKIVVVILLISLTLNLPVTSKQGINYQVRSIKIPLYIKIIEFIDRDYHHKQIVKEVTQGFDIDEEKVLALFNWTHTNIRRVPENFPIVDDHVLNIIIRGYGTRDQFSDVFATLCNYAQVEAFFDMIYTKEHDAKLVFSYVKVDKKWRVFDPYNGVYFKNKSGGFASIEQIKSGDWLAENISKSNKLYFDYDKFIEQLPDIKNVGLHRANIQSPLRRIIFEIRKYINK